MSRLEAPPKDRGTSMFWNSVAAHVNRAGPIILNPKVRTYWVKSVSVTRSTLLQLPRKVRWFWQRGRRGWAECDLWNLDSYLARVIGESVQALHDLPPAGFGMDFLWESARRNCPDKTDEELFDLAFVSRKDRSEADQLLNAKIEDDARQEWLDYLKGLADLFRGYPKAVDALDNDMLDAYISGMFAVLAKHFGGLWD